MGLALHSYHDVNNTFPPAKTRTTSGVWNHNWITFLLPYFEQNALHQRYDWSVRWNQAPNPSVIDKPVGILGCPSATGGPIRWDGKLATADYSTQMYVSQKLADRGYVDRVADLRGVMDRDTRCVMGWIVDGTSQTHLLTEDSDRPTFWAGHRLGPKNNEPGGGNIGVRAGRVPGAGWADPDNCIALNGFTADGLRSPGPCPINCTNNNESFSFHPGGVNELFADAHVQFLQESIGIRIYARIITRAGGKPVTP